MKFLLKKFRTIQEDKRVFNHFLDNKNLNHKLLGLKKRSNKNQLGKMDKYFGLCCLSKIQHHIKFIILIQQGTCIQYYINLKQEQALYYHQDKNIHQNKVQLELLDQLLHNKILEGIEGNQQSLLLLVEVDMFLQGRLLVLKLRFGSNILLDKHPLFNFLYQSVQKQLFLLCNSTQLCKHLIQQQEGLNDNMNLLYIDSQLLILKGNNGQLYICCQ